MRNIAHHEHVFALMALANLRLNGKLWGPP